VRVVTLQAIPSFNDGNFLVIDKCIF
jgi:hypothetical protein